MMIEDPKDKKERQRQIADWNERRQREADEVKARDDLIASAHAGFIRPEEADQKAIERGWKPFSFEPDPANFDPMAEVHWTLPMAIAWIVWRAPVGPCRQWRRYRDEWRTWGYWDGSIQRWTGPKAVPAASLESLRGEYRDRPPADATSDSDKRIERAWDDLRAALRAGSLDADAIDEDGNAVALPALTWKSADFIRYKPPVADLASLKTGKSIFSDVEIPSSRVVALWPASQILSPDSTDRRAVQTPIPDGARKVSDKKVLDWFNKYKDKWDGVEPKPSIEATRKDMQAAIPGISRDKVREIRKKLAPDWTTKTGPRGPRKPSR